MFFNNPYKEKVKHLKQESNQAISELLIKDCCFCMRHHNVSYLQDVFNAIRQYNGERILLHIQSKPYYLIVENDKVEINKA